MDRVPNAERKMTNLDLVRETDTFPDEKSSPNAYARAVSSVYTWIWEDDEGKAFPLGYIRPNVLEELLKVPEKVRGTLNIHPSARTIKVFAGSSEKERSDAIARVAQYWRDHQTFPILRTWRDELWPIYAGSNGHLCYNIERAAAGLFGVNRYGVHMMAYVPCVSSSHGLKIWVPTRAASKSTFPGMLDNTVAGGLMTGEDPFECVLREADEEASLPEDLVRTLARPVGTVTYIYITDERAGGETGLIYPECQWVYDLELPEDLVPIPKDGEVESFSLCTVEQIQQDLARGRFKPNCALVMLDFFLRHGILTRENEPDFDEILRHLHRPLPFPGPHQSP